ncbi:MAG: hypothetical protein Q8Q60_02345 [Candidatus Chromulinivorax sp.]|nr:hypothetical protein [Candidatus Chromulinivorax sp.]
MNSLTKKINSIKKIITLFLLANVINIAAITSNMTHRVMGTSQLLYKMIDYSKYQTSFEIAPIFSSMYDAPHVNSNMILSGKSSLIFDQQGTGDLNPTWLNLMSSNTSADYYSTVTFTPKLTQSGALFHAYGQFDNDMFFDAKTALVQCKSEIEINEVGGGNGLNSGILNAQQAFTQSDWNYGKIGQANHVVGLDNIELRVGRVVHCTSEFSSYDMLIAAFGILETPTGSGTKAEWLFEPQVGTNHWGVGFGFEALVSGDDDIKFMIAGNYRYLTPAWETRSFDLLGNGQWSRYLSVQNTYGLPTAPATLGLPGINYFTQQAYINGRSELSVYTRLQKQFQSCYFEVAYNFFCIQRETIGDIKAVPSDFGIYALNGASGGGGGVTTSSTATINQDVTTFDTLGSPISVTTDNFDKLSAAASAYATNTLTARLEIHKNNLIYGFGASIESAQSASAISTWSVWGQFGFLFDNITSCPDHHEFSPEFYDYDAQTAQMVHHKINMDDAQLPEDVINAIENDFIEYNNFEFSENDVFENSEPNFYENVINEDEEEALLNNMLTELDPLLGQLYDNNTDAQNENDFIEDNNFEFSENDVFESNEPNFYENVINEDEEETLLNDMITELDPLLGQLYDNNTDAPDENDFIEDNNFEFLENDVFENNEPNFYENIINEDEEEALLNDILTELDPLLGQLYDNNTDAPDENESVESVTQQDETLPLQVNVTSPIETISIDETKPNETTEELSLENDSLLATEGDSPQAQNETISLQDHEDLPEINNGFELIDEQSEALDENNQNNTEKENLIVATHLAQPMTDEEIAKFNLHSNQKISLDHQVIMPKTDIGSVINHHAVQPMTDEEIARFNHHAQKQATPMSEADILNKLDSTK